MYLVSLRFVNVNFNLRLDWLIDWLRSDPSTDFHAWWLTRRGLAQGCAFWGFSWYFSSFWGLNTPETPILGRECAFSSQTGKILKVSWYQNYCIDFNQIWHNDRDHQVVLVGGSNRRPTNTRRQTAAILKKNRLITISLRPFDRFWWNLACWRTLAPYRGTSVKISNFWKSKMAAAAILKITKIAISPQCFD